ncbi:MAG: metallophosphoesterase [Actinomycetota bacterium]|nr:metallophosphoesterase [Actinomycetota bacterium]
MRLFFATDIHGSDVCWRKFLNSAKHYGADVIVLGGDMTGKALVPVVHDGGERWHAMLLENRHELNGEEEVASFEQAVRRRGYYPFRTTPDEVRELQEEEQRATRLFHDHMLGRVEEWMALADERLEGSGIQCLVCPGNDDQFEVDEIVQRAKTVELAEGRVIEIDGFQLASTGWSNPTPWKTYREEEEPQLAERIERVVVQVTAEPERTIFGLHCPPYGCGLDDAPELTADMRLKHAGHAPVPVGSKAVREAIERHQPALSLHGHIHECRGNTRIGRTLCINPGSSYEQGELLGAVIDLEGGKKVKRFVLTSG